MTTQTEALKLALEALESFITPSSCEHGYWWEDCPDHHCGKAHDMWVIAAIKKALAESEKQGKDNDEN